MTNISCNHTSEKREENMSSNKFWEKYRIITVIVSISFILAFAVSYYFLSSGKIFESDYFIFIILPFGIGAIICLLLTIIGSKRSQEWYPWICAFTLIICWMISGAHFIYRYNNLNDENKNTTSIQEKDTQNKENNEKANNTNNEQKTDNVIKSNEIGDSFGSLNALFSGMALAAVAFTILLQMKELRQNREELRQNREELEGQKNELKAQNATQIQARFENSFFSLLEAQRVIAKSILNTNDSKVSTKNNPFELLIDNFIDEHKCITNIRYFSYSKFIFDIDSDSNEVNYINNIIKLKKYRIEMFNKLEWINEGRFDSYFRITYRILKFLDDFKFVTIAESASRLNNTSQGDTEKRIDEDSKEVFEIKRYYAGILRAQIGVFEQIAIFYNALDPKYMKCKNLLEKYNMFNSLRFSALINNVDVLFYKPSAFYKDEKQDPKLKISIIDENEFYKFLFHSTPDDNNFYSKDIMDDILAKWKCSGYNYLTINTDEVMIPGLQFKSNI